MCVCVCVFVCISVCARKSVRVHVQVYVPRLVSAGKNTTHQVLSCVQMFLADKDVVMTALAASHDSHLAKIDGYWSPPRHAPLFPRAVPTKVHTDFSSSASQPPPFSSSSCPASLPLHLHLLPP